MKAFVSCKREEAITLGHILPTDAQNSFFNVTKFIGVALAGMVQLVEHRPMRLRVTSSIPARAHAQVVHAPFQ